MRLPGLVKLGFISGPQSWVSIAGYAPSFAFYEKGANAGQWGVFVMV